MIGRPILYITFDGVLQPLGSSQVVRVVAELGRRGLRYVLLSVERKKDLERRDEVDRVRAALRSAGVEWATIATDSTDRSSRRAFAAVALVAQAAFQLARRQRVAVVHARSYQAAAVARGLRSALGIPYVFDARGCWIEERSGPGDWFSTPARYAGGKFVEQWLFRDAAAIVTLTALQGMDIGAGLGSAAPLLEVVPTCADYEVFALRESRPAKPTRSASVAEPLQATLRDKLVLGIVGSLNRSYRTLESLRVAKLAADASAKIHLLILSNQQDEYLSSLRSVKFPMDRVTITGGAHEQMPDWIQWIDWGLLLLDDTAAKRGSVPTKLAEFLAAGVRPVAFGCNAEMISWVRRAASGHVLDSLDEDSLAEAAATIATRDTSIEMLRSARETTEPHFGLRGGLDRYERLLRRVLAAGARER